ncbi:MAG: glycine/betaine ABC transporter substrate-binding protein [Defluviitaleaceae bacterium]|nr:glycine/betaine ABC transporter substrate-binding protein [Defluviitaleaceae bacterium]
MKKIVSTFIALALSAIILAGCAQTQTQQGGGTITLLRGAFTEIELLMQMAGMLIEEHTDLTVTWQDPMHTVMAAQALIDNHADIYVGYDGTLLTTLMGYDPSDVPAGEVLFNWVRDRAPEVNGLTLLAPFGFENTYALAVQREFAEAYNLRTISDLVPFAPGLVFGAEHEFFEVEGTMRFVPFNERYGFEWQNFVTMDIALKYAAMDAGNIDVTMVYSTDGLNMSFDLYVLEDDLAFFPEYNAAFQFRYTLFEEFAESAPNLREVLSMLNGAIDNYTMLYMNYAVDALNENPQEVARQFLVDRGLL